MSTTTQETLGCGSGVLLILAALVLNCSTTIKLTVNSDPDGANIYEGAQRLGKAPVNVEYPISDNDRARGFVMTKALTARWVSGATAKQQIKCDLSKGSDQNYTFFRPTEADNLQMDVEYARELLTRPVIESSPTPIFVPQPNAAPPSTNTRAQACTLCQGSGRGHDCFSCNGTGSTTKECMMCNGSGYSYGGRKCLTCEGRGFKLEKCYYCNGRGCQKCTVCGGRGSR